MLKHYFNEVKLAFSENKLAIYISIAILFISLLLGYYFEPYLYDFLNPSVEDLTHKVQTGVIRLTFSDIFLNNFSIICKMFILGLCFCISIIILAFNGFFVGYYIANSDDLFRVLSLIIPHGIFEFSSCILACASGLVLFNFLYKFLADFYISPFSIKDTFNISFNKNFHKLKQSLILFFISVILMVIAAIIEVYLTIPIANFFI